MVYFCAMLRNISLIIICIIFGSASFGQDRWDLRRCIEYALSNNISIRQSDIQAKISELQFKQSRLGQYPNVSFTGGTGFNSGRNQDPTSFSLITQSYISSSMQLQSNVEIFNWYSKRNTIAANQWQLEAAKAGVDKLKNDIALTVANAYLQILLAKEQEKITLVQVQQTMAQLDNTRKMVNAGSLPELNASTLESILAGDSANYISAKGNVEQTILVLKAYMNVDAAAPFEVDTPPVELIPIEKIADLQPAAVYTLALANLPQQRVNDYNLKAAEKLVAAAKGAMYPTISSYGSLSSSYILSKKRPVYDIIPTGYSSTGLFAYNPATGGFYDVQRPVFSNIVGYSKSNAFGVQLSDNFRQSVGLSISVPIFNGGTLHTNYERSKLTVKNYELQRDLDNQSLKQNIYQAYNAASIALEKLNASRKAVESSEQTFSFAQKRYTVGILSTFDLITTQNNLFRAKLQYTLNQFDYVFKMKVLEFYKGQGLKL